MPLTEDENKAILPIVERGVRNSDSTEKIKALVKETLRRLREKGGLPPLSPEDSEGLWRIAEQMLDTVKEAAARQAAGKAESDALLEQVRKEDPSKLGGKKRSRRRVTAKRFCGCVKKAKKGSSKKAEGSAIAVCTSSLLWPHGRTLHSVTCRRKKTIKTQKRTRKA
jgi:hypothetical protein